VKGRRSSGGGALSDSSTSRQREIMTALGELEGAFFDKCLK
jgi:hypothetical protein